MGLPSPWSKFFDLVFPPFLFLCWLEIFIFYFLFISDNQIFYDLDPNAMGHHGNGFPNIDLVADPVILDHR